MWNASGASIPIAPPCRAARKHRTSLHRNQKKALPRRLKREEARNERPYFTLSGSHFEIATRGFGVPGNGIRFKYSGARRRRHRRSRASFALRGTTRIGKPNLG